MRTQDATLEHLIDLDMQISAQRNKVSFEKARLVSLLLERAKLIKNNPAQKTPRQIRYAGMMARKRAASAPEVR